MALPVGELPLPSSAWHSVQFVLKTFAASDWACAAAVARQHRMLAAMKYRICCRICHQSLSLGRVVLELFQLTPSPRCVSFRLRVYNIAKRLPSELAYHPLFHHTRRFIGN